MFNLSFIFSGTVKMLNDLKSNLDFKMDSAYDTDVLYSNYTETFSGLLDHIYFTNQHLYLNEVKNIMRKYFFQIVLHLYF